ALDREREGDACDAPAAELGELVQVERAQLLLEPDDEAERLARRWVVLGRVPGPAGRGREHLERDSDLRRFQVVRRVQRRQLPRDLGGEQLVPANAVVLLPQWGALGENGGGVARCHSATTYRS